MSRHLSPQQEVARLMEELERVDADIKRASTDTRIRQLAKEKRRIFLDLEYWSEE